MNYLTVINACENPGVLRAIEIIQIVIKIIFIAVPVILVIMSSMDLLKIISSNDDELKKGLNKILTRIIACVVAMLAPSIVFSFIKVISSNITSSIMDCFANVEKIDYYKTRYEEITLQDEKERTEEIEKKNKDESEKKHQAALARYQTNLQNAQTHTTEDAHTGTTLGTTYNLTSEQLRVVALVCKREQGSIEGAKAEATLIANRFEIYGASYGTGAQGLVNYLKNSGWFASRSFSGSVESSYLAAVSQVLVSGNRTMPLYVDEHDCIDCGSYGFDIIKIVTNGNTITNHSQLKDHSNYIKNNTILYNRYGGHYTFYSFPTEKSDPFGYTDRAYNKYKSLNNG